MDIRLSAIHLYPVKGMRGVSARRAAVENQGLRGDRRWVVVGADGTFLSQRTHPRLAVLSAVIRGQGLELSAPGRRAIRIDPPSGQDRIAVTVWNDSLEAAAADGAADSWLSDFLEVPCRLAYMDDSRLRPISSAAGRPGEYVSFADGYPLLLISEASLEDLNGRLSEPLPMDRFRPNLVVTGCEPFAEDSWSRISVGEVVFRTAGQCARCSVTTVDQESGTRNSAEPLRTLASFRKTDKGVVFGVNLIPEQPGPLVLGDGVTLLA